MNKYFMGFQMTELIMEKMKMVIIIMAKPTMVKLLTMSKMNLVKINMSEIIMAKIKMFKIIMEKPTMVKLTIVLN
jgi:hypothetical protein